MPVSTPRYEHDCDRCVYLGQHQEHDLYYCEQDAAGRTLVARYGSDGSDYYSSGIALAIIQPLVEARRLATEYGLI